MTDDSIAKKVLKGLGTIPEEAGKEILNQTEKMTDSVISGQELFGVKPMSDEELERKKNEDKKKVEEETKNLLGRNVEEEIKRIREEKKQAEQEKEKQLSEQTRQREAEEAERQQVIEMPGNAKREAAKTQFAPGKKKKQQPTADQTSQTNEFKGGKID
jgi:membrane protein involved in colicin uptake